MFSAVCRDDLGFLWMTPAMLVLGLYRKHWLIMEVIGTFKIRERAI